MDDRPDEARARAAIPPVVQGALWMLLSCAVLTVLAALGRHLSGTLHPLQIMFFRVLFGFLGRAAWHIRRARAADEGAELGSGRAPEPASAEEARA